MHTECRNGDVTIVLSLDIDWIPDHILQPILAVFVAKKIPVTIFATHHTPVLENLPNNFEIGIHPNFFRHDNHLSHIKEMCALFPNAAGVRSHGLFEYSNLLPLYKDCGLIWDSTQLLYMCPNIRPYTHPSGMIRLPIFWEDDDYYSNSPDWNIEALELHKPGIKCFDFHPIHLYLNTVTGAEYARAKAANFSRESIDGCRNSSGEKGIYNFFLKLYDFVIRNNFKMAKIGDVCTCLSNS